MMRSISSMVSAGVGTARAASARSPSRWNARRRRHAYGATSAVSRMTCDTAHISAAKSDVVKSSRS